MLHFLLSQNPRGGKHGEISFQKLSTSPGGSDPVGELRRPALEAVLTAALLELQGTAVTSSVILIQKVWSMA